MWRKLFVISPYYVRYRNYWTHCTRIECRLLRLKFDVIIIEHPVFVLYAYLIGIGIPDTQSVHIIIKSLIMIKISI